MPSGHASRPGRNAGPSLSHSSESEGETPPQPRFAIRPRNSSGSIGTCPDGGSSVASGAQAVVRPLISPASTASFGQAANSEEPETRSRNWQRIKKKVVPAVLAGSAFADAATTAKARANAHQADIRRAFAADLASISRFRRSAAQAAAGNASASASSRSSAAVHRFEAASSTAVFEPLVRLRDVLTRYEHLGKLPSSSMVYAELAKPFLEDAPQLESCSLALSMAKRVFTVYKERTPAEELQRWLWCCRAMTNVDIPLVRNQASQLLIACTSSPEPAYMPRGQLAMDSLTHALCRLLFSLQHRSQASTEAETAAPRNVVFSLLNRLANGALVLVEEDEETRDGAFLSSLARTLNVSDDDLRTFVVTQLLERFLAKCRPEAQHSFLPRLSDTFLRIFNASGHDSASHGAVKQVLGTCYPTSVSKQLIPDQSEALSLLLCTLVAADGGSIDTLASYWISGLDQSITLASKRTLQELSHWPSILSFVDTTCFSTAHKQMSGKLAAALMPLLLARLADDIEVIKDARTKSLIARVLQIYPALFYKPYITCTASSDLETIQRNIRIILLTSEATSDYLTLFDNPDLAVVVLASTSAKLGQLVLADLICNEVVRVRDTPLTASGGLSALQRFAERFEPRLAAVLEDRDKVGSVPLEIQLRYCRILLKLRLTTMSFQRPKWLSTIYRWSEAVLTTGDDAKATTLYRNTNDNVLDVLGSVKDRPAPILTDRSITTIFVKLLAAMYSRLHEEELRSLSNLLWNMALLLEEQDEAFLPVSFLLMHIADKVPDCLRIRIRTGMQDSSPEVRQRTITTLLAIFRARHDMSEVPTADSGSRATRPARQQITFVPTALGSATYSSRQLDKEQAQFGVGLPIELKKALLALGWEGPTDTAASSTRSYVPLSQIPTSFVESELIQDTSGSTLLSARPGLLRRASSAGSDKSISKNGRPFLVPNMARMMLGISDLLLDDDPCVLLACQQALSTFLRDDPVPLLRPIVQDLSIIGASRNEAVRAIRMMLLHARSMPPLAAHLLFNHLLGLAKTSAREQGVSDAYRTMALFMPSIGALGKDLADLSIQEARRNKVETLLFSSGAFLLDVLGVPTIEARLLEEDDHLQHSPSSWVLNISAIRIGQNQLAYKHLQEHRKDAYSFQRINNSFHSFLPTSSEDMSSPTSDIEPRDKGEANRRSLSTILCRTRLLAIFNMMKGLHRNHGQKEELGFDTVEYILSLHSDEVNIVALATRCCLMASAKFRRIFTSANGFHLFLPSLIQTYCFSSHTGIRECIEYAWQSFYHHHEESFVFQSFECITSLLHSAEDSKYKQQALCSGFHDLLRALQRVRGTGNDDVAAILGSNTAVEMAATMHLITERPEMAIPGLGEKKQADSGRSFALPSETKTFSAEECIKLFFTVIAYDAGSIRTAHFLHLFRLLVGKLLHSSTGSPALLQAGIEAMLSTFGEPNAPHVRKRDRILASEEVLHQRSDTWTVIRTRFLLFAAAYMEANGQIKAAGMSQMTSIVQNIAAQGVDEEAGQACTTFINKFAGRLLGAQASASVTSKQIISCLKDLRPLFDECWKVIDFTDVLDKLARTVADSTILQDRNFWPILLSFSEAAIKISVSPDCSVGLCDAAAKLVATVIACSDLPVLEQIAKQRHTARLSACVLFPLSQKLGGMQAKPHKLNNGGRYETAFEFVIEIAARSVTAYVSPLDLVFACQVFKASAVHGYDQISRSASGWTSIGNALLRAFARNNSLSDSLQRFDSKGLHSGHSATPLSVKEWAMWSMFEFAICFPCPVTLELEGLVRDKLRALRPYADHDVDDPSRNRRKSLLMNYGSARIPSSPKFGSPFAGSPIPSPTSPGFSFGTDSRGMLPIAPRQPSPHASPTRESFPKIRHLGPKQRAAVSREIHQSDEQSPAPGSALGTTPRSPQTTCTLQMVNETLERVRRLQARFGERELAQRFDLPNVQEDVSSHDVVGKCWSRAEAAARIEWETRMLIATLSL